jgi:hypothetical protein
MYLILLNLIIAQGSRTKEQVALSNVCSQEVVNSVVLVDVANKVLQNMGAVNGKEGHNHASVSQTGLATIHLASMALLEDSICLMILI